ncbi:MAG: acetylglutamate kinase [Oscillospiraceae bacterium]|nr:acetylglutamate kinase [Oscillospiraceae bacterium]MDD4367794.1 acetylglutamate kinase [Oscillospiraceae bacterium]
MTADTFAAQAGGQLNPATLTPSDKAAILIEALPYIQSLSGKTVVIKYGGNAMIDEQLKQQVMEDITLLRFVGIKPVVVHGGGPDISRMLNKLKIQSEFVNGLRKTDRQTLEVAQMVLIGKTNKEIVAGLSRQGAQAIGISGIDAGLLRCRPLQADEEGRTGPLGFVGDITAVDTELIERLTADYIPVIAPIGSDYNGQSYNINADTVASQLAVALKAEKLILLTDVEGVKRPAADGSLEIAHVLVASEVRQMIRDGVISGGMIPKVQACIDTISQGVNRAHIIDGRIPHCLLLEIFTHKGIGTMFTQQKRPYYPGEMI